MVTIPASLLMSMAILLVIICAGWGWTINRSISRALAAYVKGDRAGYSRGCSATLARLREWSGPSKGRRRKRAR